MHNNYTPSCIQVRHSIFSNLNVWSYLLNCSLLQFPVKRVRRWSDMQGEKHTFLVLLNRPLRQLEEHLAWWYSGSGMYKLRCFWVRERGYVATDSYFKRILHCFEQKDMPILGVCWNVCTNVNHSFNSLIGGADVGLWRRLRWPSTAQILLQHSPGYALSCTTLFP